MKARKTINVTLKVQKMVETFDVTPFEGAAFMVHEAWAWEQGGVEMDGRLLAPEPRGRRLYRIFHNLTWLRRLPVILLLVLSIFELPGWCKNTRCEKCEGSPTGWDVFLEPNLFHALELACASLLLVETHFLLLLQGGYDDVYGLAPIVWVSISVKMLLIMDCVVSWITGYWFRLGGYLRIFIFATTVPQVRKSCWNVACIVPRFISVAFLFLSYVAFGGWLAAASLRGTDEGETYEVGLRGFM